MLTTSDTEITTHVRTELDWDPAATLADLDVSTSDGRVTLRGTAASYAVKYAAANAAYRVREVRWSTQHTTALQPLNDAELIERAVGTHAVAPDLEAFGVLYGRYWHAVFAFALSRLHNHAQAEDIASQTFLQALQALPRYQQRGMPIRHWFLRITINLIVDVHRSSPGKQARAGTSDEYAQEAYGGEPARDLPDPHAEGAIAAWEKQEEFGRLLDTLSPAQRTVIRLRFADGLKVAAVAARLGRTAGAVRALQFRGVQASRRCREEETAMARHLPVQRGQHAPIERIGTN